MYNNTLNYFEETLANGDNALNLGGTVNIKATPKTTVNTGTAATGCTVVHYGDGKNNTAVITMNTTLPAITGGANLGVGKLIYTLPAGAVLVNSTNMSASITQTQGNINADTPVVGVGTVIATGAVAVLSGTATFQNVMVGTAAANCTGTATVKTAIPTANVPLVIETASAHTLHLNAAYGWAASGDTGALLTGTVVVNYTSMV